MIISLCSFNSIKVRLKQGMPSLSSSSFLFQFHKGAIKTLLKSVISLFFFSFNSIKVRLKLKVLLNILPSRSSFNSIKVRLKQAITLLRWIVVRSFNSIKVRLKQGALPPSAVSDFVSIP